MNRLRNDHSGFTIVDITDQNHLCYCFMFPPRPLQISKADELMEDESMEDGPPRCKPLTVEEYLEYFYGEGNDLYVDLSKPVEFDHF